MSRCSMPSEPVLDWPRFARLTGAWRGVFVLAPHPDDECAGTGGLIAHARMRNVPVRVALLTDGAASHSRSRSHPRQRLTGLRRAEMDAALARLGVVRPPLCLDLPDAGTDLIPERQWRQARDRLRKAIMDCRPGLVVTTWRREPHRDHRSASSLARQAARGLPNRFAECLIWTPVTGSRASRPRAGEGRPVRLALGAARPRKGAALRCHGSQLGGMITDDPHGFALDGKTFAAMTGPFETYVLSA